MCLANKLKLGLELGEIRITLNRQQEMREAFLFVLAVTFGSPDPGFNVRYLHPLPQQKAVFEGTRSKETFGRPNCPDFGRDGRGVSRVRRSRGAYRLSRYWFVTGQVCKLP
jgi:hypothetical protein